MFQRYYTRHFDSVYLGQIDTWDYQWTYSCWAQNGLTLLPAKNLVRNIGFGVGATHTTRIDRRLSDLPLEQLDFPLRHPRVMCPDELSDEWTARNILRITPQHMLARAARDWVVPRLSRWR
jgi:hypothetical protein